MPFYKDSFLYSRQAWSESVSLVGECLPSMCEILDLICSTEKVFLRKKGWKKVSEYRKNISKAQ